MSPLLEVRGLVKRFAPGPGRLWPGFLWPGSLGRQRECVTAVDGVDLAIHSGEALGLVGESGSGKSTLARLIARLSMADAGTISLEGREIGRIGPRAFARLALRAQIQMVFQDAAGSLNPRFTVARAVEDPLRVLLPQESAAARRRRVLEAAEAAGLPASLLGRYPHQLSGGEAARAGIARALVTGPRLLVLDEPGAALDVSVRAQVLQLLDRLRRERGIAMLFVSHDLGAVRLLCQRAAVMHQGRLVETGAVAQLIAAPAHRYTAALWAAQPGRLLRDRRYCTSPEESG